MTAPIEIPEVEVLRTATRSAHEVLKEALQRAGGEA